MELLEKKEITVLKTKATKAVWAAGKLAITNDEELKDASTLLSNINLARKAVTQQKDKIVKPLNESLKQIRAFFAPVEEQIETARRMVEGKLIEYDKKVTAAARVEQDKIAARAEKGTLRPETAAKKLEAVQEAPKSVETKQGTVSFKEVRDIEVTDENAIPDAYWKLDMVLVRKDALAGVEISGVKVVTKKQINNRV